MKAKLNLRESSQEAIQQIHQMVTSGAKRHADLETRWNFSPSRGAVLSLDGFLAQKAASGSVFFTGKEPWLEGIDKLTWETFFWVCTEEMDDLSQAAAKLVIEYCLEVLEEFEGKITEKPSLARLERTLNLFYAEEYSNRVYQYHWALRHPVIREAISQGLRNRFPSR
jgi:hypothetical protein